MRSRKTKAQMLFKKVLDVNNTTVTKENTELFKKAMYDFGLYMFQLALQDKLVTLHNNAYGEYKRGINVEI